MKCHMPQVTPLKYAIISSILTCTLGPKLAAFELEFVGSPVVAADALTFAS